MIKTKLILLTLFYGFLGTSLNAYSWQYGQTIIIEIEHEPTIEELERRRLELQVQQLEQENLKWRVQNEPGWKYNW